MMTHQLRDVAQEMRMGATRRGQVRRELARGLVMELEERGSWRTLTLSRPAVVPSEMEIDICRAAFAVPERASRTDDGYSVSFRWAE